MKLLISLTCAATGALAGLLLAGIGGMMIGAVAALLWTVGLGRNIKGGLE